MPIIEFTQDDILESKVVEPMWYEVDITEVTQKPSKDGKSINYFFQGLIVCDENGNTTYSGIPLGKRNNWVFNSKAKGNIIPVVEALGGTVTDKSRFDIGMAAGKRIGCFVENDTYNGNVQNKVTKYRAAKASV